MPGKGLLHLTVKSAEGLQKHVPFGNQHCYVKVHFGKYMARTKTSKDGGQSPVWNETLFFQLSTEQEIMFSVMVERRLIKDLEIGRATLKTDTVSAQGYESAVLPLALAGKQKGSLAVVLDLKSMGSASVHSGGSATGSSTVSYSPLGSLGGASSIAAVHSSSSFTASQGALKVTNLPIMLLQQPTLALYARQQLLQQQMQQQMQQQGGAAADVALRSIDSGDALQQQGSLQFNQQQQQQHGLRAPQSSPALTGAGAAGARPAASAAAAAWAPMRTAADLFHGGRGGLASSSSEPAGAGGVMFGALDSSTCEEASVFDVAASVDGARLDALMRAVYPSQFGGAGASSSSQAGQGAASAVPQPSSAPASDGLGGFGGFAGLAAAEAALLSTGSAVASGAAHGGSQASAAASEAPDPFSSAALEAYAAAAAAAFPTAAAAAAAMEPPDAYGGAHSAAAAALAAGSLQPAPTAAAAAAAHEPSTPFEAASLQAAVAAASAPSPLSSSAAAAAARPASRLGSASGSSTDPSGSRGSRSTRSTEQLEELLETRDEQLQVLTSQLQEKERQLQQLQEQLARLQGS